MSTKRVIVFTKDSISKNNNFHQTLNSGFGSSNQYDQYNQINLNQQKRKYKDVKVVQSENNSFDGNNRKSKGKKRAVAVFVREEFDEPFFKNNASTKSYENLPKLEGFNDSFNPFQRKKDGDNLSKSTLSLHISAYENALNESEAIIVDEKLNVVQSSNGLSKSTFKKAWKSVKSVSTESSPVFQNLFNFQRQQQIDESMELPEMMQFKTSQKLFNSNNQSGQRNKLLPQFHDSSSFFKNSIYSTNFSSIRCLSTLPPNNSSFNHQKLNCKSSTNEMENLADTYATYLNSTRFHAELQERYCGGERSVSESASLVGLQLPKKPAEKETHEKFNSSTNNFTSIRCFSTLPPPNNSSYIHQLVPFSSIPSKDLGISILHLKENGCESMTPTDLLQKGVIFAKLCSLGSSGLGVVMIPVLTSRLWEAAAERPSTMAFALLANSFLGILAFTPLLLHFLAKRFVVNVFYNADTKIFTTVHYNFFLQKRALRFRAEDVVDSAIAPETKKLWLPLATCFVGGKPLLLSLDRRQYRHEAAFDLLMKNISIPKGHD